MDGVNTIQSIVSKPYKKSSEVNLTALFNIIYSLETKSATKI